MNGCIRACVFAALIGGALASANAAAPQAPNPPSPPTEPTPPAAPPPYECDLKASPDYVPGIDAKGRAVAPADAPSGVDVQIGTDVYVELRSKNPQTRREGVVANLNGLGQPTCVPPTRKSRR